MQQPRQERLQKQISTDVPIQLSIDRIFSTELILKTHTHTHTRSEQDERFLRIPLNI